MTKSDPDSLAQAVIDGEVTFDELERDAEVEDQILRNARIVYINLTKAKRGISVDSFSGEEVDENNPEPEEIFGENSPPKKRRGRIKGFRMEAAPPQGYLSITQMADRIGMRYSSMMQYLYKHGDEISEYLTIVEGRKFIKEEAFEIIKNRPTRGRITLKKIPQEDKSSFSPQQEKLEKEPEKPKMHIVNKLIVEAIDQQIERLEEDVKALQRTKTILLTPLT